MNSNQTFGAPISGGSVTVAYTGTAGTTTVVGSSPTTSVSQITTLRVVSTTDCFIEITSDGTAAVANTGMYLPAYSPEYFACPPNAKVSAIQVSAGGSIYVTPFN